jgi:hypothetical protein
MKKGCAFTFLVWAAFVALYGYLAWPKIHEPAPTAIVAVLGGTFAAMLVASIVGLFTGGNDRAALKRARAGEPMKGGRLEAASGPIRPLGAPLEAPFTGRPCVAYEYDVKAHGGDKSDYAGVALTPSVVDGIRGPAKLLGWAMLDQFSPSREADQARADAYIRSAPFEPLEILRILSVFSELAADDDGAIRKDFRIGISEPTVQGKRTEEKIVPPGQVVTVLGLWDEAKGGFTTGGKMSMNRIFPMDLDAATKKLGGAPWKTLFTGLFFFLALHAILVPMWFLAGSHQKQLAKKGAQSATESIWDERDCDRLKALLAKGGDPNSRNQGRTALMNAAREGQPACVEILIAAGARLEDVDDQGNTALAEAVIAGRDDSVAILAKAGAKDFRVTEGPGRYQVTNDSEPYGVVKEYLAAVKAGDFAAMARLVPGATTKSMEENRENLPLWQSMRPAEPDLVNGWMTDDAATITVRGRSSDGEKLVTYHLEKTLEGWRIFREWFPAER